MELLWGSLPWLRDHQSRLNVYHVFGNEIERLIQQHHARRQYVLSVYGPRSGIDQTLLHLLGENLVAVFGAKAIDYGLSSGEKFTRILELANANRRKGDRDLRAKVVLIGPVYAQLSGPLRSLCPFKNGDGTDHPAPEVIDIKEGKGSRVCASFLRLSAIGLSLSDRSRRPLDCRTRIPIESRTRGRDDRMLQVCQGVYCR